MSVRDPDPVRAMFTGPAPQWRAPRGLQEYWRNMQADRGAPENVRRGSPADGRGRLP